MSSPPLNPTTVLAGVPRSLRDPLLKAFSEITKNFRERRWEPSELNGGKLSEVVYTILRGHLEGRFTTKPAKPRNMVDACRSLEQTSATFPRSIRIQLPRMLISLYEIRNNRGVGHVGGDVDPNHMDAVAVLFMSKWVLAELIRVFHGVNTETAAAAVDSLMDREVPTIWRVNGTRRVLDPTLSHKDKSLLLLYSEAAAVPDKILAGWVEHPRLADFRKDVLRPLHRSKLIEYDQISGLIHLSPIGVAHVENHLQLELGPARH